MPNTRFAKKRQRQSIKRRLRNRAAKSAVRTRIRKVRKLAESGDAAAAAAEVKTVSRLLDKVAQKGIIHPNTAARNKARLAKLVTTPKA